MWRREAICHRTNVGCPYIFSLWFSVISSYQKFCNYKSIAVTSVVQFSLWILSWTKNSYFQNVFWSLNLSIYLFGLPGVSDCKRSCNAGGLASILGLGGWLPSGTVVKNPPADAGAAQDRVWSLSREDPLEQEQETHSSSLAWKIPWMEEPGGLQSMGSQRYGQANTCTHAHIYLFSKLFLSLIFSRENFRRLIIGNCTLGFHAVNVWMCDWHSTICLVVQRTH